MVLAIAAGVVQRTTLETRTCSADSGAKSAGANDLHMLQYVHASGHRLQILLDDERHRRITAAAQERGVSVATIVREAIDRGLASSDTKRSAAGRRLLDAPDMDVPEPSALRIELDELRSRRS